MSENYSTLWAYCVYMYMSRFNYILTQHRRICNFHVFNHATASPHMYAMCDIYVHVCVLVCYTCNSYMCSIYVKHVIHMSDTCNTCI